MKQIIGSTRQRHLSLVAKSDKKSLTLHVTLRACAMKQIIGSTRQRHLSLVAKSDKKKSHFTCSQRSLRNHMVKEPRVGGSASQQRH